MTVYSYECAREIMQKYLDKGGDFIVFDEGCLAQGLTVCFGEGLKTTVINEVYLNEWSSGQSIRMYNKMPKKYEKMIDDWFEEND